MLERLLSLALVGACTRGLAAAPEPPDAPAAGSLDGAHASPDAAADAAPACNSITGRTAPVATCTAADPCMHPIATLGVTSIVQPTSAPTCATSAANHPAYDDGPPDAFTPADGVARYACRFAPAGATAAVPRPLVVFLPGSGGSAQNVYDDTLLRDKAASYDLTGDAARPGFYLVSVNARNLHWPSPDPEDGSKFDIFFRDLRSPSANPDIADVDRVIDEVAAAPGVDASRIYVIGWSNGADFAETYAIARHATATPGGHFVAAAAVYSGGDPFENEPDLPDPSCALAPEPTSSAPILIVSRACDLYACDDAQANAFAAAGDPRPPGSVVPDWMATLAGPDGDANGQWELLSAIATPTTSCDATCTYGVAVTEHVRWPDGTSSLDGGRDREPDLLAFLRAHPR